LFFVAARLRAAVGLAAVDGQPLLRPVQHHRLRSVAVFLQSRCPGP
jgi:hypothetical protein